MFNRTYENEEEQEERFKTWKENFDFIEKHNNEANAGKHEFWLDMNKFGDMVK